ncbi:MAG: acyl-CoA thioesterase [Candidatus Acididesulfobacter diazotrophicus]|jgi:acyl-CoA thioester hydrolase|uniref:Acyl-CoA thioesterase n=1 Tax=Candidatus Acididesulfobacter diazotrophicus TaxID=2597226 RepID=A0A519BMY8_9DELT|nr:MAG: acyl-CoA thioesterase [Candidatus Acididesulfobacter diazotrophicus]
MLNNNNGIADFKFFTELKVRYEETDAMSVVYYGKYFIFFEVARTEYIKKIGYNYIDIEKSGFYFAVAESNCNYIAPARFDDSLKIYAKVEYIKNSSFNFLYKIVKKNENNEESEISIAKGYTVLVCVDSTDFKPHKIPDYIRKAIQKFEGF